MLPVIVSAPPGLWTRIPPPPKTGITPEPGDAVAAHLGVDQGQRRLGEDPAAAAVASRRRVGHRPVDDPDSLQGDGARSVEDLDRPSAEGVVAGEDDAVGVDRRQPGAGAADRGPAAAGDVEIPGDVRVLGCRVIGELVGQPRLEHDRVGARGVSVAVGTRDVRVRALDGLTQGAAGVVEAAVGGVVGDVDDDRCRARGRRPADRQGDRAPPAPGAALASAANLQLRRLRGRGPAGGREGDLRLRLDLASVLQHPLRRLGQLHLDLDRARAARDLGLLQPVLGARVVDRDRAGRGDVDAEGAAVELADRELVARGQPGGVRGRRGLDLERERPARVDRETLKPIELSSSTNRSQDPFGEPPAN